MSCASSATFHGLPSSPSFPSALLQMSEQDGSLSLSLFLSVASGNSFSSSHSLAHSAASSKMGDLGRKPSFCPLCSLSLPRTRRPQASAVALLDHIHLSPSASAARRRRPPPRPSSPPFSPCPSPVPLAPFLKSLPPMLCRRLPKMYREAGESE